jgi:hypothetical protein
MRLHSLHLMPTCELPTAKATVVHCFENYLIFQQIANVHLTRSQQEVDNALPGVSDSHSKPLLMHITCKIYPTKRFVHTLR